MADTLEELAARCEKNSVELLTKYLDSGHGLDALSEDPSITGE